MTAPAKNLLTAMPLIVMFIAVTSWWWHHPFHRDQLEPSYDALQINLNTASAAQLQLLPGIGAILAEQIIDERDAHGPYTSLENLQRVSGIGEKLPTRIAPFVVIPNNPPTNKPTDEFRGFVE